MSKITGVGNFNQTINTTFYPAHIEHIEFNQPLFGGNIQLRNLPNCTKYITRRGVYSNWFINDAQFSNLNYLTNLYFVHLSSVGIDGTISDLSINLPTSLQYLYLRNVQTCTLSTFGNFVNFTKLETIRIMNCHIIDGDSFSVTVLPPKLKYLSIYGDDLTGDLQFSTLMPYSPHLCEIVVQGNNFASVDLTVQLFGLINMTLCVMDILDISIQILH